LAKSHYSFKKRKKELERKLKQEQKRQRKFDKESTGQEENSDTSEDEVGSPLTYKRAFYFLNFARKSPLRTLQG